MELKVSEIKEIQNINFNYEELKKELQTKVNEYKSIIYTEDTIKNAKEDRAKLNKLVKALNDKKIEIKKEVLKPFEDFETKIIELVKMTQEAAESVDAQVKNFENKQKDEKLQAIVAFFEDNAEELKEILNFDKIYNEKWLNTTYKMSDIEKEIKHLIIKSRQDLVIIKNLNSEFENTLIDYYFKTLNLTETMGEKTRLEEQKKKIEELQSQSQVVHIEANKNHELTKESYESIEEIINKGKMEEPKQEELQQIDFRVWVTQEQKFYLREFLIKNNIKYGKVGN